MSSLKQRLLTAAVGIPVAVIIMLLTELWHPLVGIIVGLATALMIIEYLSARRLTACIPLTVVSVAFGLITPMFAATRFWYVAAVLYMLAASGVLIYLHKLLSFNSFTYAVFGTVLITFGMSAITLAVNNSVSSSFFFVLILLLPWMADGGGYFIGSKFGKRKLCPHISPKKTIEGALGGTVCCIASALLMGLIFQLWIIHDYKINFLAIILVAILDSAVSILGDITFSLIKRHLNIKDYGSFFPGHGGVLDRFDSIIFTAPLVVAVGRLIPFFSGV